MVQETDGDNRSINRRSYLSAIAGVAAAPMVGSAVGAADVDDEAELEDEIEAGGEVNLEPGRVYEVDDTIRATGLDELTINGNGATIEVPSTSGYVLKCGTYKNPIDDLEIRNLNFDLTGSSTDGRALECQARDDLDVSDITFRGKHSGSGKGPMLVGLRSDDGDGTVSNVEMPDGGEDSSSGNGGTGMFVSHYHEGDVTIEDCHIGPFPDNGLYCSNSDGEVHVKGGYFENCNVAGVRLNGDKCSLKDAEFEYDEDIPGFGGQRPVRCDGGDIEIDDIEVNMSINQTECIRVMPGCDSATIENCSMDLNGDVRDAISVTSGAGSVTTKNNDIDGERREHVYHY